MFLPFKDFETNLKNDPMFEPTSNTIPLFCTYCLIIFLSLKSLLNM